MHRFPSFKQWNLIKRSGRTKPISRPAGVAIIHSHLYFPVLYNAWGASKNDARVRLASFHNLAYEADAHRSGWKSKIRKCINRNLLGRGLDGSSAVSSAVAEHYQRHLGLENIKVIPNALPKLTEERLSVDVVTELRQKLGLGDGEVFLICPGRLVLEKGHMNLLAACGVLVAQGFNFKLHIIGNGPLEGAIRNTIQDQNLVGRVTLHAALPQQELFQWIQAADCFVMCSICEGFGLVAAEVMSFGCPTIATRVGG